MEHLDRVQHQGDEPRAGETVRVLVDSLLTDPYLQIDYRHSPDTTDDDSGGGLFGLNAELVFQAETSRV